MCLPGRCPLGRDPDLPSFVAKVAIRDIKVSKFQGTFPTCRYQPGGAATRA